MRSPTFTPSLASGYDLNLTDDLTHPRLLDEETSLLFVCSVVLFSVASASAAQACPILNGEYGMEFIAKDGKRMLNTEFYSTRQQGGAFFYSVDAQGTNSLHLHWQLSEARSKSQ